VASGIAVSAVTAPTGSGVSMVAAPMTAEPSQTMGGRTTGPNVHHSTMAMNTATIVVIAKIG
jgi:hypothetical protein